MSNNTSIVLADPDAEKMLLGVLLTERSAPIAALSMGLTRDDFNYEINSLVWDFIQLLVEQGRPVDKVTILSEAQSAGMLEVFGGPEYIEGLVKDCDTSLLGEYVNTVRDRSLRRRINKSVDSIINDLHSEPNGKILIDNTQKHLWRAIDPYIAAAYSGIKASSVRDFIEAQRGSGELIPYAFTTLNKVNKGRKPGTLTVWGGYTSDGKSVIGVTEALHAALQGFRVGFFGLEMTDEEMIARLLNQMSGVPIHDIEDGTIKAGDRIIIDACLDDLDRANLTMYCDPSITPADVCNIQMRERYDLILVDYLQRFDFREFRELVGITKRFKNLALSTKTCVDLLSQLTPKETRPGQNPFTKPDNNSLYGGKAIAHEANNVHYVWADRMLDEDGGWVKTGDGKIIISKARGGRANWDFNVHFRENTLRWEE